MGLEFHYDNDKNMSFLLILNFPATGGGGGKRREKGEIEKNEEKIIKLKKKNHNDLIAVYMVQNWWVFEEVTPITPNFSEFRTLVPPMKIPWRRPGALAWVGDNYQSRSGRTSLIPKHKFYKRRVEPSASVNSKLLIKQWKCNTSTVFIILCK